MAHELAASQESKAEKKQFKLIPDPSGLCWIPVEVKE